MTMHRRVVSCAVITLAVLVLASGCGTLPAPVAVTMTYAQQPGPRDVAGERQVKELVAHLDANPRDTSGLTPDAVEISSDGRFTALVPGEAGLDVGQPIVGRAGVNVAVLASLGIYTSQAVAGTGTQAEYFRELRVMRRTHGHFEQLAAAYVRLMPSPGPDPWSTEYWNWHFAPRVPPPPAVDTSASTKTPADAAAEASIRGLIARVQVIGLESRTGAQRIDDQRFLDREFYASDNLHIGSNGRVERVVAGTGAPRWMGGFECTMDAVSVIVTDEIAIATFRESRTRQAPMYFRSFLVFRHQPAGWREVADMSVQLIPESALDPWHWLRFRS